MGEPDNDVDYSGNVWDHLNTGHLEQLQTRLMAVSPTQLHDISGSSTSKNNVIVKVKQLAVDLVSGLSRSTSFATESLLGQDDTDAGFIGIHFIFVNLFTVPFEGRSQRSRPLRANSESRMTKPEFVSTVCSIIGDAHWAESAEKLFKKCAGDQEIFHKKA